MDLTILVLAAAGAFALALRFYGRFVARRFRLDDATRTPACLLEDGVDFVPTSRPILLAQHFAAISAAGPIVGPITAGLWFGWGPAILWIVLGAIFIGAAHDFSALVASLRHQARSVTELMREHVSRRAYLLFLAFIWLSLVYVIIAFADLTARQFVVERIGGGVATASVLYLALAVGLGFAWRAGLPLGISTAVFVPLLFAIIWVGQQIPIWLPESLERDQQIVAWNFAILAYCGVASVVPMWALLQPRGFLGGFFLYVVLGSAVLGILFGSFLPEPVSIQYPAFLGWESPKGMPLFPILFVTIACGACSGFHGLVSSGTTSKQVARETHAQLVGYGGMLLEGVVAVLSLATVMILPAGDARLAGDPNLVYAHGIARFLSLFGASPAWYDFCVAFGLLAFATFIYDTLDVATRLGRYVLQELTGQKGAAGRWIATALTLAAPATYMTLLTMAPAAERAAPAWQAIWPVFGSSNQLLAALTLLAVSVWLVRGRMPLAAIAIPAGFMFAMTTWALAIQVQPLLSGTVEPNGVVALVLLSLAALLALEVAGALLRGRPAPIPERATEV